MVVDRNVTVIPIVLTWEVLWYALEVIEVEVAAAAGWTDRLTGNLEKWTWASQSPEVSRHTYTSTVRDAAAHNYRMIWRARAAGLGPVANLFSTCLRRRPPTGAK